MTRPLKVFISSAMNEFRELRKTLNERFDQAARLLPGLLEGWVFEYTPAEAVGGEEAYLKHVRDCDVFVLVFGAEGTRPAVLRECEEAVKANKPILAFAQTVAGTREPPSDVGQVLKDLESRATYRLFDDPAEIVEPVVESLSQHIVESVRAGSPPHGQDEEAQGGLHPKHPGLPARRKFFDRDEVLKEITRLLGDERRPVIWLGGEGGLGKTALALEAAWRNAWRFPGVLWVPFDRMPPTLGSILAVAKRDLGFKGEGTPRQRCDQLASRGHLFVLDNLDEVLDAATDVTSDAAQVMKWLGALPPRARIIVTCRRSPNLGTCQAAPTFSELPEDAAVELFVAAAGGPRAGYNPSNAAELDLMQRICRKLGCLPLALELAGARAQETGQDLQGLLDGLEEALREARLIGRENARERSLAGCLGYSFRLVEDKATKDALAFLAAFPAIDKRMAQRLLGGDRELTRLAALRIARQAQSTTGPYWHALPPVRQAARDWLKKKKVGRALVKGAAYLESLADPGEIDADNAVEAMRQLKETAGRALSLAAKTNDALHDRGFWSQAGTIRQVSLELATRTGNRKATADWSRRYAVSLQDQGDTLEAERLLTRAVNGFGQLGDKAGEALAKHNLGMNFYRQARYDEAEECCREALSTFEVCNDKVHAGKTFRGLGLIAHARNKYDDALALYEKAAKVLTEANDEVGAAKSELYSAMAHQEQGRWAEAEELYQKTRRVFEQHKALYEVANSYHELGILAHYRGDYDKARGLYQQGLELFERTGSQLGVARSYRRLGLLALDLREYNQAKSLLAHAFQVFDRIKDERRMAKALRGLGLVAYACGSPDEARRLHGLALERLTRIGDERDSAKTRFCQAFIALTPGEAENLYREALEVFERLGDSVGVAECCQQLGTIARSIGRPEDSEAFSKRALELLSSLGIRTDVADVRLSLLG